MNVWSEKLLVRNFCSYLYDGVWAKMYNVFLKGFSGPSSATYVS